MPTNLDTAGLRELGAGVLARSVFTARGTNAIFASKLKEVVDEIAGGRLSDSQARAALYQTLQVLGYDSELSGFPGEEVPPALKGTLQDLSSFRRLDLIVRTQRALMQGAGEQWRGHQPDMLAAFPAWELVRLEDKTAPRNWDGQAPTKTEPRSRWVTAGGKLVDGGRMIALKGDPVWGELGGYDNFPDALGVDHPPFAFSSGMGWRGVPAAEVRRLGITGPDGETPEAFFASQPATLNGKLPALPKPRLSLEGVDPELVRKFQEETQGTPVPGKGATIDFSDLLARDIAAHDAKYYGTGGGQ